MIRTGFCHFKQWGDKAIALAAMLYAFANGENVGIAGGHNVVNNNAAFNGKAGIGAKASVRTDANGHNHQISGDHAPVF